jgi:hypothetical protein
MNTQSQHTGKQQYHKLIFPYKINRLNSYSYTLKHKRINLFPAAWHYKLVTLILAIYRVSGDFMSVYQDLISDIISSQKCHVNMSLILKGYRAMDI